MLSCVWLFATPWTADHQAPLSMDFSRQEWWNGSPFPSPGDLPDPGIKPSSPAFAHLCFSHIEDLVALRYAIFPHLYQYLLWVQVEWNNVHENIVFLPYWALLLEQCPWTSHPWSKGELQLFNKPLRWPSGLHNHIGFPISAHGRVDNYWNSFPCFLCAFVTGQF